MRKTVVCWQFNRGFRLRRTFRSHAAAQRYAKRLKHLWNVNARLTVK